MVKHTFKRHFTWQQLFPVHENHVLFVVSHWQFDKSKPSLIYLLYRTLLAAFLIATWCVSLSIASFSIYFTNWGYTMCVLQGVLAFLMAFFAYLFVVLDKPKALEFILKLHPIYWVIHVAATSAGFVITVIFWSVLYTSDMGFTALNFYVHGSNSIVLLIDLLIIGHPVRLLHFIYPLLFGLAYIIFSVAYYFYDTNRGGVGYVYAILDWSKPLMAFFVVIGILVLAILLHLISFAVHVIKVVIHGRVFTDGKKEYPTQSTEQLSERV